MIGGRSQQRSQVSDDGRHSRQQYNPGDEGSKAAAQSWLQVSIAPTTASGSPRRGVTSLPPLLIHSWLLLAQAPRMPVRDQSQVSRRFLAHKIRAEREARSKKQGPTAATGLARLRTLGVRNPQAGSRDPMASGGRAGLRSTLYFLARFPNRAVKLTRPVILNLHRTVTQPESISIAIWTLDQKDQRCIQTGQRLRAILPP